MPRTKLGDKILHAMQDHYGKEKGTRVFYASERAGKLPSGAVRKTRKKK